MNESDALRPVLDRLQMRALLVGGVSLLVCVVGAFASPQQFFRSYLFGFVFWASVALGSLALFMLHQMAGGGWGFVIQRLLESATRTLPLLAVLFVPLIFGIHHLYEWSHADVVARDELLRHKSAYLNTPWFLIRTAVYFLIWMGMAYLLNKWSLEQDRTGDSDRALTRRLQFLSGAGLLVYGLTATFAAVDWVMSLEPHWFSTVYGLMFIVGQGLTTLAFTILALMLLSRSKPLSEVVRASHFHDLGNLMLAFVMLWAYVAFSQFLIIWSANLPEENVWYLQRTTGGWQYFAVFLIGFHWAVPFLLLLSRKTKRRAQVLASVAIGIIVLRLFDLFWLIRPAFHEEAGHRIHLHWLDVVTPVGIGGVWIAFYLRELKARPLLPIGDPRLAKALGHAPEH